MDEVYVFGYAGAGQFPAGGAEGQGVVDGSERERVVSTPRCAVREESVRVVWAGWCDLICTSVANIKLEKRICFVQAISYGSSVPSYDK